jgi:hypothetical protein
MAVACNHLTAADLNGDGTPEIAGSQITGAMLQVAFLDHRGRVLEERSLELGDFAGGLEAGRIDRGDTVDLAVLRQTLADVAIYLNTGGGVFSPVPPVPTLARPRTLVLDDVDSDGITDLIVAGMGIIGIQRGSGDGTFPEPRIIHRDDPPRVYGDLAVGDVTGDSLEDVLAASGAQVIVLRGKSGGEFEEPIRIDLSSAPRSLFLVDLDRDGLLDVTTANTGQTMTLIASRGADGLAPPLDLRAGLPQPLDHWISDVNRDDILDLVLFSARATYILEGVSPEPGARSSFRRGDADENGKTEITDAVALLLHLFQGAESPCEDASDVDDDGGLGLTDAIVILRFLFQGGPPPGAPGPLDCGEDPTTDGLLECERECS